MLFLQAGRDLKFLSLSMSGCFSVASLVLLVQICFLLFWCPVYMFFSSQCINKSPYLSFPQLVTSRGYGLTGYWFVLIGFQWVRVTSPACICVVLSNWNSLTTYNFCFPGSVFPLTSAPSVSQWHALLWRFGSGQIGKAEGSVV